MNAKARRPPEGADDMATDAVIEAKRRWWRWPEWIWYAAASWAFVFAAMSFYWATGGTVGIATQADSIRELALVRPAWFVAVLWGTGALKAVAGLIALALVQSPSGCCSALPGARARS